MGDLLFFLHLGRASGEKEGWIEDIKLKINNKQEKEITH
jgi:hypothetical protein